MKITDKHRFILNRVRLGSIAKQHLGGITMDEIVGLDQDFERIVKAMVKAGYLETFQTPPGERLSVSGLLVSYGSGFTLYCIGPKGAELLAKEAFEEENAKTIEERVAARLKGINPEYIRKAKQPSGIGPGRYDDVSVRVSVLNEH